ncbi:MAG TPA: MurT ligase domain-containing protein, partial [Clostridia bacterium]|nr:MurT ligase domain-containing protein [Clostridia bacterium]
DNTAWLYDADLAVLADPRIVRLVVGGQRARDVRLALLLAGVPGDKIVISRDKEKTGQLLLDSPQPMTIAILYELYSEAISRQVAKDLVQSWQEAKR